MNAAPPLNPTLVLAGLFALVVVAAIGAAWVWALFRLGSGTPLLPAAPGRAVPWGPGSVVAVVVLWLALNVAVVRLYASPPPRAPAAGAKDLTGKELTPAEQLTLLAVINGGVLLLTPVLLRLTSGARGADLGLAGPLGTNLVRGVVACLLLLPCVYGVMVLATQLWRPRQHPVAQMVLGDASGPTAVLAVLSGVVLAPAAEELLFRGVLLGWLTGLRLRLRAALLKPEPAPITPVVLDEGTDLPFEAEPGPRDVWAPPQSAIVPQAPDLGDVIDLVATPKAPPPSALDLLVPNVVVSALFAGLHAAQWPAPLPLFLLSLGLGALYQRTGSLVGPMTMHAMFNGLSTAVLFLAVHATGPAGPGKAIPPPAMLGADGAARRVEKTSDTRGIALGNGERQDYITLPLERGTATTTVPHGGATLSSRRDRVNHRGGRGR